MVLRGSGNLVPGYRIFVVKTSAAVAGQTFTLSATFTGTDGPSTTCAVSVRVADADTLCFGIGASDPNVCSGHGTCVEDLLTPCQCEAGYAGADCSGTVSCPADVLHPFDGEVTWSTSGAVTEDSSVFVAGGASMRVGEVGSSSRGQAWLDFADSEPDTVSFHMSAMGGSTQQWPAVYLRRGSATCSIVQRYSSGQWRVGNRLVSNTAPEADRFYAVTMEMDWTAMSYRVLVDGTFLGSNTISSGCAGGLTRAIFFGNGWLDEFKLECPKRGVSPTDAPVPSTAVPVPDTDVPATAAPRTSAPRTNAPRTNAPRTNAPRTNAPRTNAPRTNAPKTDAPATDAPRTNAPRTNAPRTNAPKTDAPRTSAPKTNAPKTNAPRTDAPKTDAPRTNAPKTDAPRTSAPKTNAPRTSVPRTNAPRTNAPKTNAPRTSAPKTNAPKTNAPRTNAPKTNAPRTSMPATSVPLPPTPTSRPGLQTSIYKPGGGMYDFPDFDALMPNFVVVTERIKFVNSVWKAIDRSLRNNFAAQLEGSLDVAVAGEYTLHLTSDDGSRLWLDGAKQIENGGIHTSKTESVTLQLSAGSHPLKIHFFERRRKAYLNLEWTLPNGVREFVPVENLSH